MVSEAEKEKIRKEAQDILKKFGKELEKVSVSKIEDEETDSFRVEGFGELSDEDFRKRVLSNAPEKDEEGIVAEKAKW